MESIAIFGCGGFGREVLTMIKAINASSSDNLKYNFIGWYDDGHPIGEVINGFPVLGGIAELNLMDKPLSLVLSIGTPSIKNKILSRITNPHISYPTIIHPKASIGDAEYVSIGKGCIICEGVIITTNVEIKDFVILNLCCTVGHDTVIDENCAFMPSVNISGEVHIGNDVYVGTGAKIINQLEIGENTIVGAGAVVAKSLPANCTAVGIPAKPIKYREK